MTTDPPGHVGNNALPPTLDQSEVDRVTPLHLLNRYKWQVAGTTLLVCLLAALVLADIKPQYRATSQILLESPSADGSNDTAFIQVLVLRSAALLDRVIAKERLSLDPEHGATPKSFADGWTGEIRSQLRKMTSSETTNVGAQRPTDSESRAAAALALDLQIGVVGSLPVIAIAMDSPEPAKAKQIVNAVTDMYIGNQQQLRRDTDDRETKSVDKHLGELNRKIDIANQALEAFRKQAGLTVDQDFTLSARVLTETNTQLVGARAQRIERESRLIALQQAAHNPASPGDVSEVIADSLLSTLRVREAELSRQVAELGLFNGESNPKMMQARTALGHIRQNIGAEVAKLELSMRGDVEAARATEAQLQAQVEGLERQVGDLSPTEAEFLRLQRDSQVARTIYEDFLKTSETLREQQRVRKPSVSILSPTTVTLEPVYPQPALAMLFALIGGLLLSAALVHLLEGMNRGFRTGNQIEHQIGRPIVAMIPSLPRSTLEKLSPVHFALEGPTSVYAESLRSAYTMIVNTPGQSAPKVIMITSSVSGEGKSTFACSLADLLAQSNANKKIVLVDCDLRMASVLKTLGAPAAGTTIDEYLAGKKTLEQLLVREPATGLFYIPARSKTPNSAEMLGSSAMTKLIKALSESFDAVIIDTPPLMELSDARVVANLVDYIVFMVRWEKTPRTTVLNALKSLRGIRAPIGLVLSRVNMRRHEQYGYGDLGDYSPSYPANHTN
ncbi:MAG: GNVR domain-containing protein [Enhydrobacter sp.]